MKHNIKWLVLASSLAAVGAVSAADQKNNQKVNTSSAMKVVTDQQGKVRVFEAADEASISGQKLRVSKELSARLSIPKVTAAQAGKSGATMIEIGLDEFDYLVVNSDEHGQPVVTHRSSADQAVVAETK
jgi:hypothetical protein